MKVLLICLGAMLPILPLSGGAAQTAQARLYCLSLRFHQGAGPYGLYTLDLTTLNYGINRELAPLSDATGRWVHWRWFELGDPTGYDPITGTINLQLPLFRDANRNGFDDFFEVSQGVSTATAGGFNSAVGGGTVQAVWSRAAGSSSGTCVLTLLVGGTSSLGAFTHTFELLEYTGPLAYMPGSNVVSGSVTLTQADNPGSQLEGPVQFAKAPANRFNQLALLPGGWTNELLQALTFPTNDVDRDVRWPTNYYGYLEFDDGDPNTGEPDYWLWMLSIDDSNDTDHDGIPDFSDDPAAVTPPRRPRLTLTRAETNLWLAVSGDVGRVHRVQEATNLLSPSWQTVRSLTLTNDPQQVALPVPVADLHFWRVLAE